MKDRDKKKKIEANEVVSPKNTEKLYGKKAEQEEPLVGSTETVNTDLPQDFEGVDQEVGHNVYPSQSAQDQTDNTDL